MRFLYKMQQTLSITRIEAVTLLTLCGLFALGATIKHFRSRHPPFSAETYALSDSLLQAGLQKIQLETNADLDTVRVKKDSTAVEYNPVAQITAPRSTRATGSAPLSPVPININTATARLLQRLPGIGPSLAQRIITYRENNGPFGTAREIIRVSGIGPKTFEKLEPYLFVEEPEKEAEEQ